MRLNNVRFCRMYFICLLFVSVVAGKMTSVHSAYKKEVHNVPMAVIIRPFIPELDEDKVQSLMATIQVSSLHFMQFNGWFTLRQRLAPAPRACKHFSIDMQSIIRPPILCQ